VPLTIPLKNKKSKIWRKLWHITGICIPLLYLFLLKDTLIIVVLALLLIFLAFDLIRLQNPEINQWLFANLPWLFKKEERRNFSGNISFLISALLTVMIFERPVAILVMFYWVFGDAAAAIFGQLWGKLKIVNNKTLTGSLAFLLTCLLIGFFLFQAGLEVSSNQIIFAALIATLIELLPVNIDDNFTIPLLTGAIINLLA